MNLKERGITVGDLFVLFLIILTSSVLIKTLNKDKNKAIYLENQEKILYVKNFFQKTT